MGEQIVPPSQQIPTSLKVVAALFILSGVSSVIDIFVSMAYGNINFNFGVLGLFIGFGLLRAQPLHREPAGREPSTEA